jgi:hypothetical protein
MISKLIHYSLSPQFLLIKDLCLGKTALSRFVFRARATSQRVPSKSCFFMAALLYILPPFQNASFLIRCITHSELVNLARLVPSISKKALEITLASLGSLSTRDGLDLGRGPADKDLDRLGLGWCREVLGEELGCHVACEALEVLA